MLLLAVVWGLSIPVTKFGLQTTDPMTLTAMRFAVAVPLLLFFVVGRQPMPWRALPRVAGLGVLGIGVGQVAQTFGVAGTSASVGTIISATIPIFITVFAALRLGQAVSDWQKLGILTAFGGIALIALGQEPGTAAAQASSLTGAAWVLLSALTIAFYYVWSVELTREFGTAAVAAWSTLFGFLALVPWAGWQVWQAPIQITPEAVGAALYLGVVVTVAGLFLWLTLLRTVPAQIAASVQYLQPAVGIAAAAAMFGDPLGLSFVAGVALVLGGLILTVASRSKAS